MFVSMSRTVVAVVVALTLVLLSVPAAHARPIESSGPSIESAGWVDAAMSWLSNLLFRDQPASPAQPQSSFEAASTFTPMSGSCIDPEGSPRPCI